MTTDPAELLKLADLLYVELEKLDAPITYTASKALINKLVTSQSDDDIKIVYIKRWRTLVKLPVKYADEIVAALRQAASQGGAGGEQPEVQSELADDLTAHFHRAIFSRETQTLVDRAIEVLRPAAQGSRGCDAIAAERQRQISKEGWTPDHDDENADGAMASAALCYIYASIFDPGDFPARYWPWDRKWWKPADNRRNLVRAGALIAAEIDRLDRASSVPSAEGK